jgi:hypothetical protein
MARQNYSHDKRMREIKKQKKKEEKLQKKTARNTPAEEAAKVPQADSDPE